MAARAGQGTEGRTAWQSVSDPSPRPNAYTAPPR